MDIKRLIGGEEFDFKSVKKNQKRIEFTYNGSQYSFELLSVQGNKITLKDSTSNILSFKKGKKGEVCFKGMNYEVTSPKDHDFAGAKSVDLGTYHSPMPGKVIKVTKKNGEEVKQGDVVVIIEAMKMEHMIKAQKDGIIESLNLCESDQVTDGQELFRLN